MYLLYLFRASLQLEFQVVVWMKVGLNFSLKIWIRFLRPWHQMYKAITKWEWKNVFGDFDKIVLFSFWSLSDPLWSFWSTPQKRWEQLSFKIEVKYLTFYWKTRKKSIFFTQIKKFFESDNEVSRLDSNNVLANTSRFCKLHYSA